MTGDAIKARVYLVLALLLACALWWTDKRLQREQLAHQQLQTRNAEAAERRATSARLADADNRQIEFQRMEATNAAINNANLRTAAQAARADALRSERDGLRNDRAAALAAATADVPGGATDACRRYAATLDAVLGEVEAAGAEIAGKADGHASDALMFSEAWPRN